MLEHGGRIRSKWGPGHLWEHVVAEVPSSYGDEVRFYVAIPLKRCLEVLDEYAATDHPDPEEVEG